MTNELIPRRDVKGSVILIKNAATTGLLTTTELDKFLYGLSDEELILFFQEIPASNGNALHNEGHFYWLVLNTNAGHKHNALRPAKR